MTIQAIETRYAGCRFRSRLEARWAVFFDHLGASWEYEPQGFEINGTPYLPDFLLTDCGTWVEVKGDPSGLNVPLMEAAALALPNLGTSMSGSPTLLVLGPIPKPCPGGDWAWVGLTAGPVIEDEPELIPFGGSFGFGTYRSSKAVTPACETSCADHYTCGDPAEDWLVPTTDMGEPSVPDAYTAARSARFEHGEQG